MWIGGIGIALVGVDTMRWLRVKQKPSELRLVRCAKPHGDGIL